MTAPGLFWSRTEYPRHCPECGRPTAVRRPGLGGLMWVALFVFVGFCARALRTWSATGSTRDVGPPVLAAIVVAGLYRLFRRRGGERIRKAGFVLCAECGWTRIGNDSGPAAEALRTGGLALFRRIAFAFAAPAVFFTALAMAERPGAGAYAPTFLWLTFVAYVFATAFRPAIQPVRASPRNDDRTRFGDRPPRG